MKARFTEIWCRKTRAELRTDYTDPRWPGLIFRVTPPGKRYRNGQKCWWIRFPRDAQGRRSAKRLPWPDFGLGEAVTEWKRQRRRRALELPAEDVTDRIEELAAEVRALVLDEAHGDAAPRLLEEAARSLARAAKAARCGAGDDPQQRIEDLRDELQNARRAIRIIPTVDALVERFLEEHVKVRLWSVKQYENKLRGPHMEPLRDRDPSAITRQEMMEFLEGVAAKVPGTARSLQQMLGSMYSWANRRELLGGDHHPLRGMPRVVEPKPRTRVISEDEIPYLLEAYLRHPTQVFSDCLVMLAATAQRRGEICGLRWNEIRNGWIHLPAGPARPPESIDPERPPRRTKQGRDHRIWIPPVGQKVIARRQGAERKSKRYVFPAPKNLKRSTGAECLGRIAGDLHRQLLDDGRICERTTIHDWRTTAATAMRRAGADALVVDVGVLGHSRRDPVAETYDRYAMEKEVREALQTWNDHLASLIGRDAL